MINWKRVIKIFWQKYKVTTVKTVPELHETKFHSCLFQFYIESFIIYYNKIEKKRKEKINLIKAFG